LLSVLLYDKPQIKGDDAIDATAGEKTVSGG
jgi:hypothetical protein